jgi:hypothetical protein
MRNNPQHSRLDQPAIYRIKVQGRLDASWSGWFNGMTITVSQDKAGMTITTMSGLISDQVVLHGILARIRDMGLPLLNIECVETGGQ